MVCITCIHTNGNSINKVTIKQEKMQSMQLYLLTVVCSGICSASGSGAWLTICGSERSSLGEAAVIGAHTDAMLVETGACSAGVLDTRLRLQWCQKPMSGWSHKYRQQPWLKPCMYTCLNLKVTFCQKQLLHSHAKNMSDHNARMSIMGGRKC